MHFHQTLIGAANQNTNPPHILLQIEILIFLKRFLLAWHKQVFFFMDMSWHKQVDWNSSQIEKVCMDFINIKELKCHHKKTHIIIKSEKWITSILTQRLAKSHPAINFEVTAKQNSCTARSIVPLNAILHNVRWFTKKL